MWNRKEDGPDEGDCAKNKRTNDKINDKKEECSSYVLNRIRELGHAATYRDLLGPFIYGTLRNTTSKLARHGRLLKLPKENPTRFIVPEWTSRPEYSSIQRNDNKGIAVKFDFLSFLESLSWSSVLAVHNLKLAFEVHTLRWVGKEWEYCKKSRSFSHCFSLSYPVSVQCFDTGKVLVSIKSSCRAFPLDSDGLLSLSSLLGEVRNSLHASCIPDPLTWVVVQWHLNKDSEIIQGEGLSFQITFRDFFNDVARFYYKRILSKVRAEVIQSPNRTIEQALEEILNRDIIPTKR
jgi:hypothetical protein